MVKRRSHQDIAYFIPPPMSLQVSNSYILQFPGYMDYGHNFKGWGHYGKVKG